MIVYYPSDQHVLHYIKQFLTNVCDLIKYIIKYNRVTEKL